MTAVFVSFGPLDLPVARMLVEKLDQRGYLARSTLTDELANNVDLWTDAIAAAQLVIVLYGPGGISPSQGLQLQIASEGAPGSQTIVPVLLPGAIRPTRSETPYILSAVQWIDVSRLTNEEAASRISEECAARLSGPSLIARRDGSRADSPYRGLVAFEERNSADFFGREGLIESVVSDLKKAVLTKQGLPRLIALVGPSGSGKSSLALAGLLPRLREALSERGPVLSATLRPGSDPLEALALATVRARGAAVARPLAAVAELLSDLEDEQALHRYLSVYSLDQRIVLLVDQFEEIFTQTPDAETRSVFIANLLNAAVHADGDCVVIITIRADFYGMCSSYPRLAFYLSSCQVLVSGMSENELAQAIELPALNRGVRFEPGLVRRLIEDCGSEPGALPLLQFALLQLWEEGAGSVLTHEAYEAVGGVGGALAHRADSLFAQSSREDQHLFRRLLLRLVSPGDRTDDTRRRVKLRELAFREIDTADVERMVALLSSAQSRLITVDTDQAQPTIEIAHEALLTRWPLLRSWIDSEREDLLFGRGLTAAAQRWSDEADESHLLRGTSVVRAIAWDAVHDSSLNAMEEDFLVASLAAHMSEVLQRASGDLASIVSQLRNLGPRVLEAAELLRESNDTVKRRSALLIEDTSSESILAIIEALDVVDIAEFRLILEYLLSHLTEDTISILESRACEVKITAIRSRRLLALAQLVPASLGWASLAGELTQGLISLLISGADAWLELAVPVAEHIYEPLLEAVLASFSPGDQYLRLGAMQVLRTLAPLPADVLARLLAGLGDELTTQSNDFCDQLEQLVQSRAVFIAELRSVVRSRPPSTDRSVTGGLSVLAYLHEWTAFSEEFGSVAGEMRAVYELARTISQRGVSGEELILALSAARTALERGCLLLSLSSASPRAVTEGRDALEQVFRVDADSFVHSSCGLALTTLFGCTLRDSIERELASSVELDQRKSWWVTLVTGVPLTFVRVPAGEFLMGSPSEEVGRTAAESRRLTRITQDYYLADRVITRAEYEKLHPANAFDAGMDEASPTSAHPVVGQTWLEASDFCAAMSERIGSDLFVSLPTEAQWERGCRAETESAYYFGEDPVVLGDYAWYLDNCPDRKARTTRLLWPNPYGLFDMHGGVYEWCADLYSSSYDETETLDPVGPALGPGRVLRGGGYNYSAVDCRSAYRYFTQQNNRNARIGFRLAASRLRPTDKELITRDPR